MKKVSRILVVEDTPKNLESITKLQEAGYEVDIAKTFCEAYRLMVSASEESDWADLYRVNLAEVTSPYQAVLSDLNIPLGEAGWMPCRDVFEPQPLGYSVILTAALLKIPYALILTDTNHHAGPLAATFDMLKVNEERPLYRINDTNVLILDERDKFFDRNGSFQGEAFITCDGPPDVDFWKRGSTKNWYGALQHLLERADLENGGKEK
jgi:CheY-like chemotaxis protein